MNAKKTRKFIKNLVIGIAIGFSFFWLELSGKNPAYVDTKTKYNSNVPIAYDVSEQGKEPKRKKKSNNRPL